MNRTICDCLEEIRKAHETRNYSYILSLVEEIQSMANRMESALYDKNDLERARKDLRKYKKELKEIEKQIESKKKKIKK